MVEPEDGGLLRRIACLPLPPGKRDRSLARIDDAPVDRDLLAQQRLLNGRSGNVGSERDVRRLQLQLLGRCLRLQRLDLPPIAAEHIRHEADGELRRVQCEIGGARGGGARERVGGAHASR